jgi:hypothetical protein
MSDNNGGNGSKRVEAAQAARRVIDGKLLDPNRMRGKGFTLPGFDGLPFRGAVPDLKDSDVKQPTIGYETFVEILDLSIPEQLQHYEDVWQLISNSYAILSAEEKHYDEGTKNWRVFIRWALTYAFVPGA